MYCILGQLLQQRNLVMHVLVIDTMSIMLPETIIYFFQGRYKVLSRYSVVVIVCTWAFLQLSRKPHRGTIFKSIIYCIPWYLVIWVRFSLFDNQNFFIITYVFTFLEIESRKNKKGQTVSTCKIFPTSYQAIIGEHWRAWSGKMHPTHILQHISDRRHCRPNVVLWVHPWPMSMQNLYTVFLDLYTVKLLLLAKAWGFIR